MRILNICTLLPYPPIDGSRNGVYYPVKYLSERGHAITFACVVDKIDTDAIHHMESFCEKVIVQVHDHKPALLGALASLFVRFPYDLKRYINQDLMQQLREASKTGQFDVIEVGLHSAWYGMQLAHEFSVPLVYRVHNLHWVNFERSIHHFRNILLKVYLWIEARKLRRQELIVAASADLSLTVSDTDAKVMRSYVPTLVCRTVPAGVALENVNVEVGEPTKNSILWMGSLKWHPNRDSFWWFYNDILPEIVKRNPDALVRVVGSHPPEEIRRIRHPNVHVLGFVDDLQAEIRKAEVCVVPLRVGSGIRIKLLELFSLRRAIVSTTIGAEGLNVHHGDELLIADTPSAFAEAVVSLQRDPMLRRRLGEKSYEFVSARYDWRAIAKMFETAYEEAVENFRRRGLRVEPTQVAKDQEESLRG
jgi:glycosyltransferase involved in cell wall biosynthesis